MELQAFSQGRGQKVEESSVATVEEVTAQRRAQRAEKKKLRAVAEVFNAKMGNGTGEKVLKLVMESPIVSSSTSGTTVSAEERDGITVAQFLRMTPDLDKSHIGVVLGERLFSRSRCSITSGTIVDSYLFLLNR